ncbi:putative bifunctional diguanylate cyclase/phosphodiesterase [Allorhizobium borbori]|uniref:Diguanylate cyclase (GGDEF)-like protein n=1 Tax=Allorhizobium borbori TaxID=485907 RepID=A0A7W6P3T6_9HYPH|nr:bifunctional diguanylate cyclase/phosphodiesterase [Allorhizobium borbori]MBB4105246.1 diguanylate cyclase (GGDEF)-like protein [Allorhizobium borbori]PZU21105.1 MAG: GGDEF-domain containing protein [Shinella sp.]
MKRSVRNRAYREAAVFIIIFVGLFMASIAYDAHERLDAIFRSYENIHIDEMLTGLCVAGLLGVIYAALRIRDLSTEIEQRMQAEKRVEWIACHDPLTELANRRMLESRLTERNKTAGENGQYAIYSLDLRGFKRVNDLFGQDGGNQVLKTVAKRLNDVFPDDEIYRLGDDEFVVIAARRGASDPLGTGARLLRYLCRPMHLSGMTADIGACVGIALMPEDATDMRTAMNQADCAMYAAKKARRNTLARFDAAMEMEAVRRATMETELRRAIRARSIVPHYQPLIDLRSNEIVAFEALARWQTSPGQYVSPAEFIPLAEEAGLIVELTDQLLRQACADAVRWPESISLSFNISPTQLSDPLLGLRIIRALNESGLSPRRLEVEVTESALINDTKTARRILDDLTAAGIRIALDDFGTGYSSLSQLTHFHFDKIKIDRSFIRSGDDSERQDKVVRAIIALGLGLGIKITAEGIESESQLRWLADLGCDIGQGYFLGYPADARQAAALCLHEARRGLLN